MGAIALVAVLALWKALALGNTLPRSAAAPWVVVAVFLTLFGLWCAFAHERWHMEMNRLEHRVGVGRLEFGGSYESATLEIRTYRSKYGKLCFRLYVVQAGVGHFLMERDVTELQQLGAFIFLHTGWVFPDDKIL